MTDTELARLLMAATYLEGDIRAYWEWTVKVGDLAERDQALIAGRHATALKRSIELWITARACRAALQA